ncbi:MAG: HD domain-containing protein [Defluviitaleaceae bacterium]|nr:HD domain-containing protein [Defluviitaleaceae bacterium]
MKIFRCPVHDVINLDMGNPTINNLIINLIDSPEFQRLRRIKQLGLADFAYPNATHTRFAHSLGVAYLAKRMITQILSLQGQPTNNNPQITAFFDQIKKDAPLTVIAALLHDIGHGILSHVTENVIGIHHEEWTKRIILGDTTINHLLTQYDPTAPSTVCDILSSAPTHRHSARIIDGTIDVDKMDYLLRDSHMTGSGYGRFDLEWLLNVLTVGIYQDRAVIGLDEGKGLSVAEDFIMARIYMLKNVYLHKTSLIAQKMLELLFKRLSQINTNPYPNQAMEAVFKGTATLPDFLSVSDEHFQILLSTLTTSTDPILNNLANGLYHRKLYKEITENQFHNSPPYHAFQIDTSTTGNKMQYQAGKDEIFLFNKKGQGQELLELSSIAQLTTTTPTIYAGLPTQ